MGSGCNTKRRAMSQRPPPITSSREDRHASRMSLMDRPATSRAPNESKLCLQRQDGHISVCRHRVKRTLASCIRHRHTGPSPCVMDNARPHVAGIVRIFLDTENIRLLLWPARSPNLLSIETLWSMVVQRLACHHTPVSTVDKLLHRVEAMRSSVPYMLSNLCLTQCAGVYVLLLLPESVVWDTDFSGSMHPSFLKF
ncbi:transposable element Tcb1 transposase [Trichonephila clavipes]|nr:transposable element Tcb1 transposase [Trichonephila clavipes]